MNIPKFKFRMGRCERAVARGSLLYILKCNFINSFLLKLFAVTLSHDLLNRLFYYYFPMTLRILLSPLS